MGTFGAKMTIAILKGLSHFPLSILYVLSDVLYLFVFKIAGYRKLIVLANLHYAFPEKTDAEINLLCQNFYRHFFDLMAEVIRLRKMSPREVRRRMRFVGQNDIQNHAAAGQSTLAALGHMGNWELCAARYALEDSFRAVLVYKPLRNKVFDQFMSRVRTRFGCLLYPSKLTLKFMARDKALLRSVAMVADQKPAHDKVVPVQFFGKTTHAYRGLARFAKMYDLPIVYISIRKERRGHYLLSSETLVANPSGMTEGDITQRFFERLERDILRQPEIWLWTHRRWRKKFDQKSDIYDLAQEGAFNQQELQ